MFFSHTTASTDSKIRPPSREEAHDRRRKELDKMHGRSHSSQNARHPNLKNLTAEERAKYELERKKVAKYKEDKLKARRDHTRMILESHAQSKRRSLLGKQSEFLANLEFRNKLPDLPFDTKFLQYPHESDRLIKWKPNTLEQDYVFEIHEEPNLGLSIDLIDPAKYEGRSLDGHLYGRVLMFCVIDTVPTKAEPLEAGDEAVLMMKETQSKDTKYKARPVVSWLRRTEYMGNDLYEPVHKFKSEVEFQSELREGTENALAEEVQVTLEQRAEDSFKDINDPSLIVHPFKKNLKAAKVWDVYPDQSLYPNKYAHLSYDVLPSTDDKGKSIPQRESRALLCGVSRKNEGSDHIQGSILLPVSAQAENPDAEVGEKYGYFREYLLSVQQLDNVRQELILYLRLLYSRRPEHPESQEFTYCELLHRIQLKKTKISGEDQRRHGAIVHRREYSKAEEDRRNTVLSNIGGLYNGTIEADDELDDENPNKRRKADHDTTSPTYPDEEADGRTQEQDSKITTIESDNDSPDISDGSSQAEDE
ncbi:unnamed protein product [Albugo candida]|uniref:RNA polymerase II-associated factor 1 homolog n=1 Tax=Albugo candida TaxID=65357 RepID=A0A024FZ69_9STRA|nr:unnamed protein product [Albugo candida]|eukprot:CCI39345.1 unnamed protein product [Albugo candida]